ncbi:MAG TPA: hypothetical protein VE734_08470 [Terriglobales bacterium]|jgi:hypothetical protein|nr:hypothetical protein [Terriglobales bacterium]
MLSLRCLAGTPGIFQGQVYRDQNTSPGWIFVQGRNGMLRRVEVSRARVIYAASVPAADRAKNPTMDLVQGAEVRVTAEQDGTGEWRASRIEIVRLSRERSSRPRSRFQTIARKPL